MVGELSIGHAALLSVGQLQSFDCENNFICLQFFDFSEKLIIALMRLVNVGTVQIEFNRII